MSPKLKDLLERATKRPWIVSDYDPEQVKSGHNVIVECLSRGPAPEFDLPEGTPEAHAALIAIAVNHFERLVAANEALLARFGRALSDELIREETDEIRCILATIEDAVENER